MSSTVSFFFYRSEEIDLFLKSPTRSSKGTDRNGSQSSQTTGYHRPGMVQGRLGDGYRVASSGGRGREKNSRISQSHGVVL
jgi:hypothetical protein